MNILWLSDSTVHPTGYANQTRLACNTLQQAGHNVYQLGHNYQGMITKSITFEDGEHINYTHIGSDGSPYALNIIPYYTKKYNIDILCILLDTFMLKQHGFDQYPLTTKSLFWFPSDGGYFPDGCETIIKKVDYPIAMSQFGQAQLTNHYGIKNIRHIPHGCKTTVFKPLDKLKLRQQYSWERLFAVKENTFYNVNMNITDKFIIGFVGRNQPRKNPAGLIKAFSIFHKDKPDAYLLMHTDPFDPARMCDLQKLAEELNCGHKILWTGMRVGQPFSTSKLVEIYNLMDCFALYTSGEGFGIPVIEAMSCEIPVLMTDATTCKELVTDNNAGYGVKLAGESRRPYPYEGAAFTGTITGSWGVERAHEDYVDGASKFEMLYTSWKRQDGLLEKLGKAGRKAVLEKYDWDSVVGPAWVKLMEEIKG